MSKHYYGEGMLVDKIDPTCNVRVRSYSLDSGELLEERESHNVLVNTGRSFLRDLVGASSYDQVLSGEITTGAIENERVRFMGLGIGGALQTNPTGLDPAPANSQAELVTVTELEDPVQVTAGAWLKQVEPQSGANYFPSAYTIKFVNTFLESEVSFAGSISAGGVSVGTAVPVAEAGLFISGADAASSQIGVSPAKLIAYNIFSPIVVTTNIAITVEWEFRF